MGNGLHNSGTATLNNSTVSGNTAATGGGIWNTGGTVILKNTIVASNSSTTSGPDCYGSISSAGYNLISNISGCTFTAITGDQINVDPKLGSLIGLPGYYSLQVGSPAIDAGNPSAPGSGGNACLISDERGITRPVGTHCDIGAYEYTSPGTVASIAIVSGDGQHVPPGVALSTLLKVVALDVQGSPVPNVSVTFTAPASGASGIFASTGTRTTTVITDANGIATTSTFTANAILGSYTIVASVSGVGSVNYNLQNIAWYVATTGNDTNNCQTPIAPCATINEALGKSGFIAGDTVLVADGTYTGSGSQVVLLNKDARLSGGWNASFTSQNGWSIIDGQSTRIGVIVQSSSTIERFVVQNGSSVTDVGGIYNGGTLVLNNSIVRNNTCCSDFSVIDGGAGISNWGTLTVNNSTITGNTSFDQGGGLYNNRNGILTLNNSTISGNVASTGAGIASYHTVKLNNSTVSKNRAINGPSGIGYGGGIYFDSSNGGTFTLQNSLIADNSAIAGGPDCFGYGSIGSDGYNLIGSNTDCTFNATTGDLVGTSANIMEGSHLHTH
jgi:hypothetical protein